MSQHRDLIIEEIVEKQRTFVHFMNVLSTHIIAPLQGKMKSLMEPEHFQIIFGRIPEILQLDSALLEHLAKECAAPETARVGRALLTFIPFLKSYSMYISTYNLSMSFLREYRKKRDFCRFLDDNVSKCGNLKLEALLIMPIQHIPRIKLLIEELLKHTPTDHPDYADLQAARKNIHEVAGSFEQAMRDQEVREQILAIVEKWTEAQEGDVTLLLPSRRLLHTASGLTPINFARGLKKKQQLCLFLFNDAVALALREPTGALLRRGLLPLLGLRVEDIPGDSAAMRLANPVSEFEFATSGESEKRDLAERIRTAASALLERLLPPSSVDTAALQKLREELALTQATNVELTSRASLNERRAAEAAAEIRRLSCEIDRVAQARAAELAAEVDAARQALQRDRQALERERAELEQRRLGVQDEWERLVRERAALEAEQVALARQRQAVERSLAELRQFEELRKQQQQQQQQQQQSPDTDRPGAGASSPGAAALGEYGTPVDGGSSSRPPLAAGKTLPPYSGTVATPSRLTLSLQWAGWVLAALLSAGLAAVVYRARGGM